MQAKVGGLNQKRTFDVICLVLLDRKLFRFLLNWHHMNLTNLDLNKFDYDWITLSWIITGLNWTDTLKCLKMTFVVFLAIYE